MKPYFTSHGLCSPFSVALPQAVAAQRNRLPDCEQKRGRAGFGQEFTKVTFLHGHLSDSPRYAAGGKLCSPLPPTLCEVGAPPLKGWKQKAKAALWPLNGETGAMKLSGGSVKLSGGSVLNSSTSKGCQVFLISWKSRARFCLPTRPGKKKILSCSSVELWRKFGEREMWAMRYDQSYRMVHLDGSHKSGARRFV